MVDSPLPLSAIVGKCIVVDHKSVHLGQFLLRQWTQIFIKYVNF